MAKKKRDDAAIAAEYYSAWRLAEHRGVEEYDHRIIVFGNDGDPHSPDRPEAAEEVRLVREAARREGLEEDGFATTSNSWVLVVRSRGLDEHVEVTAARLHKILQQAADRAWGGLAGHRCTLTTHRPRSRPSPEEFKKMTAEFKKKNARPSNQAAAANAAD